MSELTGSISRSGSSGPSTSTASRTSSGAALWNEGFGYWQVQQGRLPHRFPQLPPDVLDDLPDHLQRGGGRLGLPPDARVVREPGEIWDIVAARLINYFPVWFSIIPRLWVSLMLNTVLTSFDIQLIQLIIREGKVSKEKLMDLEKKTHSIGGTTKISLPLQKLMEFLHVAFFFFV